MGRSASPSVIVLAGPNGAGKSTTAPALLRGALHVPNFVNADVIARGLSAFDPDRAALPAGRIMLTRLRLLGRARQSFAFETTLASRSFAPWLRALRQSGYRVHLIFLWLPSADFAVRRVAQRVRAGGHSVPRETIRRRYRAGLRNFFGLYRPLAATWRMYDNSQVGPPRLIAMGEGADAVTLFDHEQWKRILRSVHHES
jgi:predicted ABC-type ATPase